MIAAGAQSTCAANTKIHARDAVDRPASTFFSAFDAMQALRQHHAEIASSRIPWPAPK